MNANETAVTSEMIVAFVDAVNPMLYEIPPPAIVRKGIDAAIRAMKGGAEPVAAYVTHSPDNVTAMELTTHGLLGYGKHALYSRPASIVAGDAVAFDFCWLVELFLPYGGNSLGHYHTGFTHIDGASRTTQSPHEARRYASLKDAQYAASKLDSKLGEWRAVEHGFERTPPIVAGGGDDNARRYLWLRDRNNSLETRQRDRGVINGPSCYHDVGEVRELKHGDELDAAIDAAMLAAAGKEPTHD